MQETINYKRPTYSSAYTQGYQTSQINGRFSYEYFCVRLKRFVCASIQSIKHLSYTEFTQKIYRKVFSFLT